MLATAALFVKLDSAKNLPVSYECCSGNNMIKHVTVTLSV